MSTALIDIPADDESSEEKDVKAPSENRFFISTRIKEKHLGQYLAFHSCPECDPQALLLEFEGEIDLRDEEGETWRGFTFSGGGFRQEIELKKVDRIAEENLVISNGKKWKVAESEDLDEQEAKKLAGFVKKAYERRDNPEEMIGFSSGLDAYISKLRNKYMEKLREES